MLATFTILGVNATEVCICGIYPKGTTAGYGKGSIAVPPPDNPDGIRVPHHMDWWDKRGDPRLN